MSAVGFLNGLIAVLAMLLLVAIIARIVITRD